MIFVIQNAWALFLGMFLLMLGNGLQGPLLAVRGDLQNFSAETMSLVMSGYFLGFLGGSRLAPWMIQRVGHVRVFAAMASVISAVFILYPVMPDPAAWTFLRVLVGFAFASVYVVAESWLNDISENETRGQVLSGYLIVQMAGIIAAQYILSSLDPTGYDQFILISVLVSVSFLPILLSVSAVPVHETTRRMTLTALYQASPLGVVSAFVLGAIFGAQFGMSAVYATAKGLSLTDLATFVATIYLGGLILQYPIGYASDRMDRRVLIAGITAIGAVTMLTGVFFTDDFRVILAIAFVMGGVANPLYSLVIAYVNDFLDHDDMAAASSGLVFMNGVGAILGPLPVGWMIANLGPDSYFTFIAALFGAIALYALFRMTQRAAPSVEDTAAYATLAPQVTTVAVDIAQDYAVELAGGDEATNDED